MGRKGMQRGRKPGRRGTRLLEGILHVSASGHAQVETQEGSFPVPRRGLREGMDGDRVSVTLAKSGSRQAAWVQGVLERAHTGFAGSYSTAGPLGVVTPLDARIKRDFYVLPEDRSAEKLGVGIGDVVYARITGYPSKSEEGVVTIERRIGAADALDLAIESAIASHGLATVFPEAVLSEAKALRDDTEAVLEAEPARLDLRGLVCVTIDPADARDYDDAVGAERLPDGGYRLDVHIADVAHYVAPESAIDLEARMRTCSVYLADRVLPMLPERLSNELCSLRPKEDRLAMTVTIFLDAAGEPVAREAHSSLIRSSARLDYDRVDAFLAGGDVELGLAGSELVAVSDALMVLDEIARLREKARRRRGAIDFESSEVKAVLDDEGHAVGVQVRRRTRGTALVEEAMLLANEAVARMLVERQLACAYRVHDKPPADSVARLLPVLSEFGLAGPEMGERLMGGDPFAYQELLERAKGSDVEQSVNALCLRMQSRAEYLPHNLGHYALGASAYLHFTSPIRRYPDILAHRALKGMLADDPKRMPEDTLALICQRCSEQERVADAAERQTQRIKLAEFMSSHVGEAYAGIVSGCEAHGMYVVLEELGVEGMVPMRLMGDEWVSFDPERLVLEGQSTGRVWRPGKRVAVRVASVDVMRGYIDLELLGTKA